MLWPRCAPPAQNSCSCLGYRRTCELVQRLDAAAALAVRIFVRNGKRGCTSKQEASAPAESCEVGDRVLLQSSVITEEEQCPIRILPITEGLCRHFIFLRYRSS